MVLGVDFGTSFSQVAVYDNGNVKMLETGGNYGTPSVFYYDEIQGEHVGSAAETISESPVSAPGNLIRDVKMRLNETFALDDKVFTSTDIVKSIYKEIITQAIELGKREYGEENFQVDGIVISHPAKFGMQEIGLLADAARDCIDPNEPIKVLGTIKEPVAAALNYYHADPQPDGTNILVFDLGGGTCDLAIVKTDRKDPAEFLVVDSDMVKVGGRDWDKALIEYVIEQIDLKNNNANEIRNDPDYMNTIKKAVIDAKHDLTEYDSATVRVNYMAQQHNIKITRDLFNDLTVDLLEQVLDKLDQVYERNANIAGTIKSIICVGGSSKMPQIENGIKSRFPDCEVRLFQPEYSVVGGAAIYADRMISGFDFVPFSYGIRARKNNVDGEYVVRNIITKGDRFPVTHESRVFKVPAGAPGTTLAVYESECTGTEYGIGKGQNEKLIGHISLNLDAPASYDVPICCQLTINALHTIELEARDKNGAKVEAQFKLSI